MFYLVSFRTEPKINLFVPLSRIFFHNFEFLPIYIFLIFQDRGHQERLLALRQKVQPIRETPQEHVRAHVSLFQVSPLFPFPVFIKSVKSRRATFCL